MMTARQICSMAVLVSVIGTSVGIASKSSSEEAMLSLGRADAWLNSAPLSAEDLRGKVVLIDFWTYTCINWRRTLPWLRAWAHKYKNHGVVVIGVHTPEFTFEKDIDNVRRAAQEQDVSYPIAIDSDYTIWNAFHNHYWPALYFLDARGRIRHRKLGEGGYERLELIIQQLLTEAGHTGFDRALVPAEGTGAEAAADWSNLATPETYVGYRRSERLASLTAGRLDRPHVYGTPSGLKRNEWALSGDWTLTENSAVLNKPWGKMTYRFHARDVHLVMGPKARSGAIRFRVSIDGQPPGESHGSDIDTEGRGLIRGPRMYHLIRQPSQITDRQFEIEFLDPGAEVFAFTFG